MCGKELSVFKSLPVTFLFYIIREKLDDHEIDQYLRFKEIDNEAYQGQFYQLEVYQGKEPRFVVEGIIEQDLSDLGRKANFLDDL